MNASRLRPTVEQRSQVADLLARGFSESCDMAQSCGDSSMFINVAANCVKTLSDSCVYSSDIYLHQLLRFLAFAEACDEEDLVIEQAQLYSAAVEESDYYNNTAPEGRTSSAFLILIHSALQHAITANDITIHNVISFMLNHIPDAAAADASTFTLADFVTTDVELLLRNKAAQQVQVTLDHRLQANVKLIELCNTPLTLSQLWGSVLDAVHKMAMDMSDAPHHRQAELVETDDATEGRALLAWPVIFDDIYSEVWELVAQRTQNDACPGHACLWRALVSWLSQDENRHRAAFSFLMFWLYSDGMLSVLRQMTRPTLKRSKNMNFINASEARHSVVDAGRLQSSSPAAFTASVSTPESATMNGHDSAVNDVSISVAVPTEAIINDASMIESATPSQTTSRVITISRDDTIDKRIAEALEERAPRASLSQSVQIAIPAATTVQTSTVSSCATEGRALLAAPNSASVDNTLASLQRFVSQNKASWPDGLPKLLTQ